jgi:hypothetical protein
MAWRSQRDTYDTCISSSSGFAILSGVGYISAPCCAFLFHFPRHGTAQPRLQISGLRACGTGSNIRSELIRENPRSSDVSERCIIPSGVSMCVLHAQCHRKNQSQEASNSLRKRWYDLSTRILRYTTCWCPFACDITHVRQTIVVAQDPAPRRPTPPNPET